MEPHVQKEYEAIRRLLADIAKRQDRAEKRAEAAEKRMEGWEQRAAAAEKRAAAADKRMDRWEQRADREEKRTAAWETRTDARLEKHDKQIQATRRLVETGMKMLTQLVVDVREMKKTLRLLVETRTNGNGRRKHPPFYTTQ